MRFCLILALLLFHYSFATTYHVSTTGDDLLGDGSTTYPWKTLLYAVTRVAANQGHTIQVEAGTFVESGLVEVPLGVNITGAGIDVTIIKADSSFYYYPAAPDYSTDKFLISLNEFNQLPGNQTLSGFTIDGDGKKLHGGIYVRHRNNVIIDHVKVINTHFMGIWLWDVQNSSVSNSQIINASWGSASYCVGALSLGNLDHVDISNLTVDENTGYGIKAIGPSGGNNIFNTSIHDSHISVSPTGLWNSGTAPNIAIELWQINLVGCQIYNTYVDNTISLVNSNAIPSTGIQTMRVHHNTLDMDARAHGAGYGLELTIHDAEVDHNYFIKGSYGIANWSNPMQNWSIHHNTFYALAGTFPGEIVRSQWSGLHNVKLYNNTVEFAGTKTMNVVGVYGGVSDNVDVKNNLFINNNTAYSYYPNQLVHLENGATVNTLTVMNNSFYQLPIGTVAGTYSNNLTSDPLITLTGVRPDPYYMPKSGSPLIDAGLNVGYAYQGSAPDIGAYETGSTNALPSVNITNPTNNAIFTAGSTVTVNATATDSDGTITKVEFFQGTAKLGEDLTSPYSFAWANVPAGSYSLTARATDNLNAITVSAAVPILVNSISTSFQLGLYAFDATLAGTMTLTPDPTAYSGSYFSVPAGNGKNYYIPPSAGATFNFQLPSSDTYFVWARVKSPTASNQSYYIYNGNGTWFNWQAGVHTTWTWVKLTDSSTGAIASFVYSQGLHGLQMAWSDDNVQIDRILITNDAALVPAANVPPTVNITSPANNTSFTTGSTVTINANATDSDGTIAKVEFFQGTTKLGEDLTSPYSFAWTSVPVGSYFLTAKATDNITVVTTSTAIAITLNAAPAVSITSPANNAIFTAGSTVTINATATDDGTIIKVEFFQGTTKLGEDLTSPYSFAWTNIPAGSYSLTAKATDNVGAMTTSTAIAITVNTTASFQLGLFASDATLSGGMTLTIDPTASSGSYFSVPAGNGKNYYIPPAASATFNFQLPNSDTYFVWARVKSPTVNNQSYYIYNGNGTWFNWQAGVHTTWTWVRLTDSSTGAVASFTYSSGLHELQMAWYDDNVQIDRILITNDAALVPAEPIIASQITVFPNPITDSFTIQYTSPTTQQAQVSIFDQSGTLIMQTVVAVAAGLNNIVLSTTNIYNGNYILVFTPTYGSSASTTIVIYR